MVRGSVSNKIKVTNVPERQPLGKAASFKAAEFPLEPLARSSGPWLFSGLPFTEKQPAFAGRQGQSWAKFWKGNSLGLEHVHSFLPLFKESKSSQETKQQQQQKVACWQHLFLLYRNGLWLPIRKQRNSVKWVRKPTKLLSLGVTDVFKRHHRFKQFQAQQTVCHQTVCVGNPLCAETASPGRSYNAGTVLCCRGPASLHTQVPTPESPSSPTTGTGMQLCAQKQTP